jgi:hypothetical protein
VNSTFSLAVPHADWIPVRAAKLRALEQALGLGVDPSAPRAEHYRIFNDRGTHWVWSDKLWKWSIAQPVTHCLALTDDTLVAPRFWELLAAMVEAHPDEAIGLMSPLPEGSALARRGLHGYTIGAGVTGPGYLLPRELLVEFVKWRGKKSWDFVTYWNEDSLINVFLGETRRRSWHPVPSIADHDVSIESSVGHDTSAKTLCRPAVLWTGECPFTEERLGPYDLEELARPDFWRTPAPALDWPASSAPQETCIACHARTECRPHGPGGAPVCHGCSIDIFEHRMRGPQA